MDEYAAIGANVLTSSLFSNGWAVLIVTAIMRRAQLLESAQNIIFIASTSSCDADGSTATVLLTIIKVEAVPIAVLVDSSQSRVEYATAFKLVKRRFKFCFGNKQAPQTFMNDNSSAEKGALHTRGNLRNSFCVPFMFCKQMGDG
ncbi:hypothetical protein MRX96_008090 [Rhipicephalus microplus]